MKTLDTHGNVQEPLEALRPHFQWWSTISDGSQVFQKIKLNAPTIVQMKFYC